MIIITERISARQLILRRISFCVCMYVCMSVMLRNANYCMWCALVLNSARSCCRTIVYVCHVNADSYIEARMDGTMDYSSIDMDAVEVTLILAGFHRGQTSHPTLHLSLGI